MSARLQRRFDRTGTLALDPTALFELFTVSAAAPENQVIGDVEVVEIRGPLEQREGFFDSYEAIAKRVKAACDGGCASIVLRIDSPGGDAAGIMEAARGLRAAVKTAGKRMWAYVDHRACSAAYALACAAERIVVGHTACVGSIGIIDTRIDVTASDATEGVRYAVVASGARKADGHPHVAVSDAELKARQGHVDSLAAVFFGLVAELRGPTPEAVKATEAGVFHGAAAIAAGLADEINSFDSVLAALAGRKEAPAMPATFQDARATLEEVAKGDDANAQAAKRAIAAMDADASDPGDDKDKTDKTDDEDKTDKTDDEDKTDKTDDEDKTDKTDESDKASASSSSGRVAASTAGELAATVSHLGKKVARLERAGESQERTAVLASRPDIDAGLAKLLSRKPVAEVREILAHMPKPAVPKPAAASAVTGTRGEGQGTPTPSAQAHDLDLRMGLVIPRVGVERVGNVMRFGVLLTPATEPGKDGGAK